MAEKFLQPEMGISPKNYDRLAELVNFWLASLNDNHANQICDYAIREAEGVYLVMIFTTRTPSIIGSGAPDPIVTCKGKEYPVTGIIHEWDPVTGFDTEGWITYKAAHLDIGDVIHVDTREPVTNLTVWATHLHGE